MCPSDPQPSAEGKIQKQAKEQTRQTASNLIIYFTTVTNLARWFSQVSRDFLAQAISDSRLAEVVRRHFKPDTVAYSEANEMLSHLSREMSQNFMLVVQPDAEHSPRQYRGDGSLDLDWFFAGQNVLWVTGSERRWGGKRPVLQGAPETRINDDVQIHLSRRVLHDAEVHVN
jgi:hypothetical protein